MEKNILLLKQFLKAAKNESKAYNFYWKYKENVQQ